MTTGACLRVEANVAMIDDEDDNISMQVMTVNAITNVGQEKCLEMKYPVIGPVFMTCLKSCT
jgi:hypothetical protein